MSRFAISAPFELHEGKPVQLLRTGQWYFPDFGHVEFTPEKLKHMADNFNNKVRRQDLPISIEHNHDLGAFGWVKRVYVSDDGNALMAEPNYSDRGLDLVKADAFRYVSAEVDPAYTDKETNVEHQETLLGFTLTNFPRIKDMAPIAASELTAVNLDTAPALTFSEMIVGISSKRSDPMPPEDKIPPPAPVVLPAVESVSTQQFAELKAAHTATELKLAEIVTAHEATKLALAEQTRLLGIEQQTRILLECGEVVEKAKRAFQITPAQATSYLELLPKMDAGTRAMMFSDIQARPPLPGLTGEAGSGTKGADADTEDQTRSTLAARQTQIFAEAKKSGRAITMREALLEASKQLSGGN